MNINTRKYIIILIFIATAGHWLACTKSDDYKKYLVGGTGELVYTGKADSVKVFPGRNRVLLTFILQSDPTITGAKVYWGNRTDSAIMSITRTSGVDTIHMYVDSLPEGTYNFEVTTFDAHGNKSVPSDITSNVYGDKYSATLLNIPVVYTQAASGDTAVVVFGQYDPTIGLIGAEASYNNDGGKAVDTIVSINTPNSPAFFLNYPAGNVFMYRTLYLPEPTAIDTFSSPYTPLNIQ